MGFGLVSFERVTVDSSIQVGVRGPTVWVKVEGRGSFLNSGNLKEFAREMLDRGYREFVVDLADCAMMDSTFMGTMASVALRLKELGRGHIHVVHCRNRSRELLSGLWLVGFSPPTTRRGEFEVWNAPMKKFRSKKRSFSISCTGLARLSGKRFGLKNCIGSSSKAQRVSS